MMADEQALQGQSSHLANGGRGRSQLLPYQPHGFTVFIENPRRGGGGRPEERGRGAGRVSAANWGIWGGGGVNIFFQCRNVHQDHDTHNFYCWGIHIAITHPYQLHNLNCRGINLLNACVSLLSACLPSMIPQKGNYTAIMHGELISNCTHTSIIVGELIV